MAHFAKLDENNKVLEVIVVNNNALNPNDEEGSGLQFLAEHYDGYTNWKQTSYNGNFRKNYASIGGVYDPVRDAFIDAKLYNSWILNESTCRWEAPVPFPTDGKLYEWDESTVSWKEIVFLPEEE